MASGETLQTLSMKHGTPPSASAATPDVRVASDNMQVDVWDYDSTADESIDFKVWLPQNYGGGGIDVIICWSADTATTGNVKWNSAFKSFTDDTDDADTKAFAAAQSTTAATATVTGQVKYTTISHTDGGQIDSLAVGEMGFVRVTRNAAHANDTMNSNDAELWGVELRETA